MELSSRAQIAGYTRRYLINYKVLKSAILCLYFVVVVGGGGGGDVQETGPCSGGMHEQAAAPEGTHSDDAELTPVELDKVIALL